jgi:tetratricopeptide (TPR) repeat protein
MVKNRYLLALLLSLCFLTSACGQSEEEKKRMVIQFEKKAFDFRMQGKNDEALKEQLKVIELYPNDAEARILLADIYIDLGNFTKAVEESQIAVNLSPNKSNTYYQLARALRRTSDKQSAIKAFENSLRLNPKDTNAWMNLGATHEELKDPISAKKAYEEALKVNPEYVPAVYYLAELEVDEGRIDNAIKLFQKAIDIKIPKEREPEELDYQPSAKKRIEELRAKKKKP